MNIQNSKGISAFGGMNFVLDYLEANDFGTIIDSNLPGLPAQCTYRWRDVLYSILGIYLCGGDYIEDLDTIIKAHFKGNPYLNIPSPDTVLRRLSQLRTPIEHCKTARGSVEHSYNTNDAMAMLNIKLLRKMGVFKGKDLTLDYDNTIIFNEKADSKMTYKRGYGYQPGVCTINETHVLYLENRNGNSDAKAFQKDTLKRMFNLLEGNSSPKVKHFRADAASYQYDVINLLGEYVNWFYIGCRNSYIEKYFNKITNWQVLTNSKDTNMQVGEIKIVPFVKQAKEQGQQAKPYRLIVKRKPSIDGQGNLFTQDAYEYRAILTNNWEWSAIEIANFYNHRGNMERQFDILKNDFGWSNMPFSALSKNTVFLYFSAICRNMYNSIIAHFSTKVKGLKPNLRVKRFLFKFIVLPCRWIRHSRQNYLRIYGKIHYL